MNEHHGWDEIDNDIRTVRLDTEVPEAADIEAALIDVFQGFELDEDMVEVIRDARTFSDAGVLTMDRGIVIRLSDGSEYQLTIVQSGRRR